MTVDIYEQTLREAEQERADRADPNLTRLIESRDLAAAAGQHGLAASQQRLIEHCRATRRGTRPRDRDCTLPDGRGVDREW